MSLKQLLLLLLWMVRTAWGSCGFPEMTRTKDYYIFVGEVLKLEGIEVFNGGKWCLKTPRFAKTVDGVTTLSPSEEDKGTTFAAHRQFKHEYARLIKIWVLGEEEKKMLEKMQGGTLPTTFEERLWNEAQQKELRELMESPHNSSTATIAPNSVAVSYTKSQANTSTNTSTITPSAKEQPVAVQWKTPETIEPPHNSSSATIAPSSVAVSYTHSQANASINTSTINPAVKEQVDSSSGDQWKNPEVQNVIEPPTLSQILSITNTSTSTSSVPTSTTFAQLNISSPAVEESSIERIPDGNLERAVSAGSYPVSTATKSMASTSTSSTPAASTTANSVAVIVPPKTRGSRTPNSTLRPTNINNVDAENVLKLAASGLGFLVVLSIIYCCGKFIVAIKEANEPAERNNETEMTAVAEVASEVAEVEAEMAEVASVVESLLTQVTALVDSEATEASSLVESV